MERINLLTMYANAKTKYLKDNLNHKIKFQGPTVNISWIELDAFMMKAQTREMTNLINAYNEGYTDCKAGLPNKSENESNTNI